VPLVAREVGVLANFYTRIGMRRVARLPGVAILELRGGTHLAISSGEPQSPITLDLMVDDLDATHQMLQEIGSQPSTVRRSFPHRVFDATDPEGNRLLVHSSHVAGVV
jgi:predicted enzyme related to lactoylglutathione lyase